MQGKPKASGVGEDKVSRARSFHLYINVLKFAYTPAVGFQINDHFWRLTFPPVIVTTDFP